MGKGVRGKTLDVESSGGWGVEATARKAQDAIMYVYKYVWENKETNGEFGLVKKSTREVYFYIGLVC